MTSKPAHANRRPICPRAGCRLPRWTKRDAKGRQVLTAFCSAYCRHWDIAARNALHNGNERQAATLLEAAAILDARKSGGDPVHGVQIVAGKWIVHTGEHSSRLRHRRAA
ncbi:hypothetical protein [Streptomyces sp. NPDC048411]|uniref:hypothetical protein n=1 Tax=Streptomyces sp. NPDC048411 TaxID=3157206 RepID=UPI0034563178